MFKAGNVTKWYKMQIDTLTLRSFFHYITSNFDWNVCDIFFIYAIFDRSSINLDMSYCHLNYMYLYYHTLPSIAVFFCKDNS